jgi:hypothetical protein
MVRTVFAHPNPWHLHTDFLIRQKWLRSRRLTPEQREHWADALWLAAYGLFVQNDPRAGSCLWIAFRYSGRPRVGFLALACLLGLSRDRLIRLRQAVKGMTEAL